jgi:hypothetical protein
LRIGQEDRAPDVIPKRGNSGKRNNGDSLMTRILLPGIDHRRWQVLEVFGVTGCERGTVGHGNASYKGVAHIDRMRA